MVFYIFKKPRHYANFSGEFAEKSHYDRLKTERRAVCTALCQLPQLKCFYLQGQRKSEAEGLDSGQMIAISAFSGVTTSVFVVCWLISVEKGAYMMLDVFLMSAVLFRERLTAKCITGLVISFAGLIMTIEC